MHMFEHGASVPSYPMHRYQTTPLTAGDTRRCNREHDILGLGRQKAMEVNAAHRAKSRMKRQGQALGQQHCAQHVTAPDLIHRLRQTDNRHCDERLFGMNIGTMRKFSCKVTKNGDVDSNGGRLITPPGSRTRSLSRHPSQHGSQCFHSISMMC